MNISLLISAYRPFSRGW